MKLSVALITYNEGDIIEKTLSSIADIADEIVVVDSVSTDDTENLCRKFPKVKFLQRAFDGFGTQKNFAVSQCSGEWILFLDADEIPDREALLSIQETVQQHPNEDVFKIRFINILFGKAMKYGGWANTYRERLFRREKVTYNADLVHESLQYSGTVGILKGNIRHYTYKNVEHHVAKMNVYSTLMARRMQASGKRTGYLQIYLKQAFSFIKSFFLQLGLLDGIWGYHAAKTQAHYTFLKYMKLYELQSKK